MRIDEYLRFCARLHRVPRAKAADADVVAQAKSRCGLDNLGRRPIAKLSKGYRQKLGIAQAILYQPRLLILDEPMEGLDPVRVRQIRALERDSGVIFSSRLLPDVQVVCDQVAILHQGRLVSGDQLATDRGTLIWRLRLAPPADCAAVGALDCVAQASPLQQEQLRVVLKPDQGPEDLARQVVAAAGLGLREFTAERSDLERVFFDLIWAEERA